MIDFSDLTALANRLDEIQQHYNMWKAEAQQSTNINPEEEAEQLYDELCLYYWTATPEQRASIRLLFSLKPYWRGAAPLLYIRKKVAALQETGDVNHLRLGLAAASIEDSQSDYRDTSLALYDLHQAAREVNINPARHFAEIAELSSDQIPTGGTSPMKEVFTYYARPRLPEG